METLIHCADAAFGYDGAVVVNALNFDVHESDYLCVTGENGSGKSTLIKGLLGLIPPLSGRRTVSARLGKNRIGFLSQQAAAKNDFPAGVREIVLSGFLGSMGLRPWYTAAEKAAALAAMRHLEIEKLQHDCFRELSGGQQRRVLLARALCAAGGLSNTAEPRLLVLDEPAAGLDPLISAGVYRLLKELRGAGITIIMVTHELDTALSAATHILHLHHTQIFFGNAADFVRTEAGRRFTGAA